MAVTSDGEEISSNATKTDGFQPSEKHCEFEEQGEDEKSIPEDADCDTRIQDQKPADRTGIHPIFPMKNMAHLPSSYTLNTDHTEAEEQPRKARDIAPSALMQRRHWHTVDDRSEPVRCALMTPVNLDENVSPPTPAEIMELLDTKKNDDWDAMYDTLPEEMQLCESDLAKRDLHITPEIDLTDEEGYTRVKAALKGHLEIVDDLTSYGANLDKQSKGGLTPLHAAAQEGHGAIADYLTLQGADVNTECDLSQTSLHKAASHGNDDNVASFIVEGCDVNKCHGKGQTPLHAAAEKSHTGIIISLIQAGAVMKQRDSRCSTPLRIAIQNAQTSSVRPLVLMGADASEENGSDDTPLHSAPAAGHTDIVKYLTEQRSDRNKKDNIGTTSLHLAVRHGHIDIARYLLLAGTEVTKLDGKTLLYTAARFGHIDIVELLISNGADVNEEDWKGMIPLHGAAISGNIEIMEYLIQHGSHVNKSDIKGWTPFNAAVQYGHLEAVKYLINKGARQNKYGGNTPLYTAVRQGHLELTKFFISRGADVNAENDKGLIPLHSAAGRNHLSVMEYLMQQGSDVNKSDAHGWTPLNASVQSGHLQAVQYLLANGAKQNRYAGMTPLYLAARSGHVNIVKFLISKGADMNEENNKSLIPLHAAAARGHIKVMEYLITEGSDVNKSDAKGWTPFNAAVQYGHLEAVKYLMACGAKQNRYDGVTPLYAASRFGHMELVKFFISNGSDVNEENDSGRIPLHGAATRGHMEVMEYLIQQGAHVNGCDSIGWTPFNAAVRNGHLEAVKLLMAKGARGTSFHGMTSVYIATQYDNIAVAKHIVSTGYDVNERSECGRSPLHAACYNGNIDAVRYLVGHNANVNEQDQDGWTPLHIAAQEGNRELVAFLIMNGADIDEKDIFGMTPLQVAQNAGHANVMDGISVCEDGTTSEHILLKDIDTQLCLRGRPLQSIAPSCDARLSTQVDKLEDESDYDISDKGNGISSKYHSAMALDGEKCYNEADNPFVYAKAECLDKTVQDAKVHQNEAPEDPIPWERRSRLDRLVTSPPEQFDALPSSTYNTAGSFLRGPLVIDGMDLNGFDPPFPHTPTVEENGPNEETESSCQTPGETTNDIKGPSSGLATGQNDQEKDSPDVCKRPFNTRTLNFAQEESCEDCVENGAFARLMEERKTIYRSTRSRNHSLLTIVQAASTLLLLPWNSVLVGATGSHKEVELQAGTPGTIPFHVSWPQDDSSYVFPYFTLRFASKQRPFCINGMSDPQGFEYSSQYFKFTTIKYETSSSLSVNLTISNVNALDSTSYVYTVHLYERKEPWSEVMAIKARVLPGPAKCALNTATDYSPNLYEAYCNASRGDDGTTITCYQDSDKIPFKDRVRTNGLVTRGVFWVQKDKALSCCSHYVSDEPHQQTCHDFVWHPAETHTPNISNRSLVTRDGVGHHTESVPTIRSSSMSSPNDSSSPSEKIIQSIVFVLMISVITLILIQ